MFWDLVQSAQISAAKREIASNRHSTQRSVDRAIDHVEDLERRVEGLALSCQSMWELLRDNLDFSEDDIRRKMREVDLRDGVEDGQMTALSTECASCGQVVHAKRTVCLYCGASLPQDNVMA